MPNLFSSGGGQMKFPTVNNRIDLRYPEAVGLENELRDYFRGILQSPNMGFTPRQTYDPMSLYMRSIANRGPLVQSLTQTGAPSAASSGGMVMPSGSMPQDLPHTFHERPGAELTQRTPFGSIRRTPMNVVPSWQNMIASSRATRPAFPNSPEAFEALTGDQSGPADTIYRTILRLVGQLPPPGTATNSPTLNWV